MKATARSTAKTLRSSAKEPAQVSLKEAEILLDFLREHLSLDGDIVEFGCYRGDTSVLFERLIEQAGASQSSEVNRPRLWIYDSFEGLPAKTKEDASAAGDQFKAGELFVTKKEVVLKFKRSGLKVPVIRKGFFENLNPATDVPEKISFAFLDGDLYSSIKTSLHLVAPRLHEQGIIIVHDYNNPELPGSAKAVDEFLRTHPMKLQTRETLAILTF